MSMSPNLKAKVFRGDVSFGNKRFSAVNIEMENASIFLLSESKDQLGTLAVALPTRDLKTTPLSSALLGDKNMMSARLLAERLAAKRNKMVLVSVHLKTVSETEATPVLLKLAEKASEEVGTGEEQ